LPLLAIPKPWGLHKIKNRLDIIEFTDNLPVPSVQTNQVKDNSWLAISNGRFVTLADNNRIRRILTETKADIISINVAPDLAASHEKVLTTSNKDLVGFRLFYEEAIQPMPIPRDWPHHLFIKYAALTRLLHNGALPLDFGKLIESSAAKTLMIQNFRIGGTVFDLAQDAGLLTLVAQRLGADYSPGETGVSAAGSARIFGRVLFGKNVEIGENAIVAGPAIIGDNVKIGADAVIRMSVIGPEVSIQAGDLIEQKVLFNTAGSSQILSEKPNNTQAKIQWNISRNNFRNWEGTIYARYMKRICDIIVSSIVLVLFAPFIPLIMLAVKLTSPGPVFFKDTRQGLHGKNFKCLKFRTMQSGAHKMQDRLRGLSKTDGPQFMIPDDPRITAVGKFLRETYLDEIPQFINVLLGQMSVVGPRPSPERENRLCPFWRDARLSVRPGVTGLWQVYRTRGHMRDFQEWIHFDIKYVRELSPHMDFLICLQTAKKMAVKFISQF
jgi:lipopolysaccharide/colanic/teichoic acid biosynthesis glycosyltransferase